MNISLSVLSLYKKKPKNHWWTGIFQDMKSVLSDNRVGLQLIVALDFCRGPLAIAQEAEWL